MSSKENIQSDVDELVQLVTFLLEDEEFGFDIFKVKEINKMMKITKVPNSPSFVKGVVNLRGNITPIIDLRSRLGLPEKENDNKTAIIVIELNEQSVGLIVDEVNEVLRIPASVTEPPPDIVSGVNSEYITAVAKLEDRLLTLLNLDKLLSLSEQKQLKKVA